MRSFFFFLFFFFGGGLHGGGGDAKSITPMIKLSTNRMLLRADAVSLLFLDVSSVASSTDCNKCRENDYPNDHVTNQLDVFKR